MKPRAQKTTDGIFLAIAGDPAPKGSKKIINGRAIDDAKGYRAWVAAVSDVVDEGVLRGLAKLDGPLQGEVVFFIARPKKTKFENRPAGPPDLSKLIRAIEDPLNGRLIADDARIVKWNASKVWAGPNGPGAYLTLRPLRYQR